MRKLGKHLKKIWIPIMHQNKLKIDKRFKCEKWNHKSRRNYEKNYILSSEKSSLRINKIQKPYKICKLTIYNFLKFLYGKNHNNQSQNQTKIERKCLQKKQKANFFNM